MFVMHLAGSSFLDFVLLVFWQHSLTLKGNALLKYPVKAVLLNILSHWSPLLIKTYILWLMFYWLTIGKVRRAFLEVMLLRFMDSLPVQPFKYNPSLLKHQMVLIGSGKQNCLKKNGTFDRSHYYAIIGVPTLLRGRTTLSNLLPLCLIILLWPTAGQRQLAHLLWYYVAETLFKVWCSGRWTSGFGNFSKNTGYCNHWDAKLHEKYFRPS